MTPKLLVRDVSEFSDLPDGLDRVEDVYIFDDDVRVHCASLTASIECEYLYTVLHCADGVDQATRDQFEEDFGHTDQQVEYFSPSDPRIVDLNDKYDDDGDDEWADIVDDYRCNHAY